MKSKQKKRQGAGSAFKKLTVDLKKQKYLITNKCQGVNYISATLERYMGPGGRFYLIRVRQGCPDEIWRASSER